MHDIFFHLQRRARGYELVTLSELAARKGSVAEAGAVYSCFG